jgi:hypothetical protein
MFAREYIEHYNKNNPKTQPMKCQGWILVEIMV